MRWALREYLREQEVQGEQEEVSAQTVVEPEEGEESCLEQTEHDRRREVQRPPGVDPPTAGQRRHAERAGTHAGTLRRTGVATDAEAAGGDLSPADLGLLLIAAVNPGLTDQHQIGVRHSLADVGDRCVVLAARDHAVPIGVVARDHVLLLLGF